MDVNKAFLEYFDANNLGEKDNEELAEIRAAFVSGFNHYAALIKVFNECYELLDDVAYENGGDTVWASLSETAHEALIGLAEKHHPELGKRLLARLERDCDITDAA